MDHNNKMNIFLVPRRISASISLLVLCLEFGNLGVLLGLDTGLALVMSKLSLALVRFVGFELLLL